MAPKKRGAKTPAELQSDQTIAETITDQTIVGTLAADGVTDAVATMTVDEDPPTGFSTQSFDQQTLNQQAAVNQPTLTDELDSTDSSRSLSPNRPNGIAVLPFEEAVELLERDADPNRFRDPNGPKPRANRPSNDGSKATGGRDGPTPSFGIANAFDREVRRREREFAEREAAAEAERQRARDAANAARRRPRALDELRVKEALRSAKVIIGAERLSKFQTELIGIDDVHNALITTVANDVKQVGSMRIQQVERERDDEITAVINRLNNVVATFSSGSTNESFGSQGTPEEFRDTINIRTRPNPQIASKQVVQTPH